MYPNPILLKSSFLPPRNVHIHRWLSYKSYTQFPWICSVYTEFTLHCFLCLWLFFPVSHCPQAPSSSSYLRRGCVSWIAESPFVGGCPYLLRSTTFRQLVAKGGTLGRSTVACCVITAIMRIAAMLVDFLKASQLELLCPLGEKLLLDTSGHEKAAGWAAPEATQRECRDWNVTEHYQWTQRGPIVTVVLHDPEILSRPSDTATSLTVGLRGKTLWGQWFSQGFWEVTAEVGSVLTAGWVADHHPNVWLFSWFVIVEMPTN